MPGKSLFWLGSSRTDLRRFPGPARRAAGFQLRRGQQGLEHRVFYIATFSEGIYVLHAFEKKSPKTLTRDLGLAKGRYRALVAGRRG